MSKFINFTVSDEMQHQIERVGTEHGHIHAASGRVNLSATLRYLLQVALEVESQNYRAKSPSQEDAIAQLQAGLNRERQRSVSYSEARQS